MDLNSPPPSGCFHSVRDCECKRHHNLIVTGYYWIKIKGPNRDVIVGRYFDNGKWMVCGSDECFIDSEIELVSPFPIKGVNCYESA